MATKPIIETPEAPRKARLRVGEWALILSLGVMSVAAWLNPLEIPFATRSALVTVGILFTGAALALGEEQFGWRYWFRTLLPVPVVPFVYLNLGPLIPLVNPRILDSALVALDRSLLGADIQTALYAIPLPPWAGDILTLAYSTFFFNPIVLVVVLAYRRDPYLSRVLSALILTFVVSYAGYFIVPAYGPRATVAQERYATLPDGLVGGFLRDLLDNWEKTKTDAFPSGHTMVTLAVLFLARRRAPSLYNALLPVGALLIAATVLLTYHYLVDVLAAVPLTALSLLAATLLSGPVTSAAVQRKARAEEPS